MYCRINEHDLCLMSQKDAEIFVPVSVPLCALTACYLHQLIVNVNFGGYLMPSDGISYFV